MLIEFLTVTMYEHFFKISFLNINYKRFLFLFSYDSEEKKVRNFELFFIEII